MKPVDDAAVPGAVFLPAHISLASARVILEATFQMSRRRANKILMFLFFLLIITICGQKEILSMPTSPIHHGYEILTPNNNLVEAGDDLDE